MILVSGVIFLYLFNYVKTVSDLEVGDRCGPKYQGVCTLVTNCPEAVEKLKRRQKPGLETCGFQGTLEIVCCSKKAEKIERIEKIEKVERSQLYLNNSVRACREYSKNYTIGLVPSIIGGKNVSLGEYPYMAAVGYPGDSNDEVEYNCGGMLISERFVLTAAHCFFRPDRKLPSVVRLGKIDLFGNLDNVIAQDIPIEKHILHPDYDHNRKRHDIALLRLASSAKFNDNVKPVCLNSDPEVTEGLLVLGWGIINVDTEERSRFLQVGFVDPYDLTECNRTFYNSRTNIPIYDTNLCAFSKGDVPQDTCQGDSGGPIQIQNLADNGKTPQIVVGITSYGRSCGGSLPSVYTRVSSYLDWIAKIVWS